MSAAENAPQFHFDIPPPFSYEDFKSIHFGRVMGVLQGPGADYLKSLDGENKEFLTRLFYLMIVVKLQNENISHSQMLYEVNYGLVRYFLDQGQTAEAARLELSKVPWDSLPGMDDYDRETANAIAMRAFADAVAGRPRSPLH